MSGEGSHESSTSFPETPDIETASDAYAGRFAGPVGTFFLEWQARTTLELISRWPGATVLDVGGGHSQTALPLVRRGFKVTVTGSSESCRSRLDRVLRPSEFEFVRCDLLSLPFRDRQFDVVVAFRLLPHVNRWQALIGEMCRVASRAVILDYPDRRSFNLVQSAFFAWKKAIEKNTRTFQCFTRRQLFDEFARRGFDRSTVKPEFFFPMVLHRAMGAVRISRLMESAANALGITRMLGSPVILRAESTRPESETGSEGSHPSAERVVK